MVSFSVPGDLKVRVVTSVFKTPLLLESWIVLTLVDTHSIFCVSVHLLLGTGLCPHHLAIVNEAAVDVGERQCVSLCSQLFWKQLKVEFPARYLSLIWGEEQTAFLELCSFASLPAKREGCNFSASSLTRVIFWLVCLPAPFENSQPPNKQEVVSYCGFDILSLSGC